MILTQAQLDQLVEQARQDAPHETCGMIGGKDGRALKIYPLKNIHETPVTRYYADPLDILAAEQDIDAHGWEVVSIYHSHPATRAYPSETDLGLAFWPNAVYIIISLMNPDAPKAHGYFLDNATITETNLEIVAE